MITTIIFDLGNVTVDFSLEQAYQRMCAVCQVEPEKVKAFFLASSIERDFTEGKVDTDTFFTVFKQELNATVDFETFANIYNDIFTAKPEMEAVIRGLKKAYPVHALSNTNAMHMAFLREHFPIMHEFGTIITSFEEGCQKPDQRMYKQALEKLNVRPDAVFFIDDIEENVNSAQGLGINAVHFTDHVALMSALNRFNISR